MLKKGREKTVRMYTKGKASRGFCGKLKVDGRSLVWFIPEAKARNGLFYSHDGRESLDRPMIRKASKV